MTEDDKPELNYEVLVHWIRNLGISMLPAILKEVLERCQVQRPFLPNKIGVFVRKITGEPVTLYLLDIRYCGMDDGVVRDEPTRIFLSEDGVNAYLAENHGHIVLPIPQGWAATAEGYQLEVHGVRYRVSTCEVRS